MNPDDQNEEEQDKTPIEQQATSKIGTSTGHWFGRGLMGGIMIVAACNALSYFFRTPGLTDLLGRDHHLEEAIGFPFELWREDHVYFGGMFIDYAMAGLNLLVGIGLGTFFGLIAVALKSHFNRWIADFEADQPGKRSIGYQFSIKSILIITSVAAMLVAALTTWNGTKQVLLAIYFLGPLCLVVVAMMPNKIHWHHRVIILTILAGVMISVAITTGIKLEVPLDRVMLGIFVSWTPQSAFGALILTTGLIVKSLLASPAIGATTD